MADNEVSAQPLNESDPSISMSQYIGKKWNTAVIATCNAIATADGSGIKKWTIKMYKKLSELSK